MDEEAPPDSDSLFAANVRMIRERNGMSQEEVAAKMSERGWRFHQTTVNKIENRERKVSIGEAEALAKVLRVRLDTLLLLPDSLEFSAILLARATKDVIDTSRELNAPLAMICKLLDAVDSNIDKMRDAAHGPFATNVARLDTFAKWSTPKLLLDEVESLQARGVDGFIKRLENG